MKEPLISVVMTVYNKSEYLQEAVNSILNQSIADFEFIIVVEYGASVDVKNILIQSAKEDERIVLLYNQERLGVSESLNKGICAAKGKYIARMDDDDISLPARFEKQLHFLETNSQIGICGTYQTTITPEYEAVLYCATEPQELKGELLFGCQISHTSVMFRRKVFIEKGWRYKKDSVAEDFELWLDILNDIEFANIGEPLVKHRYGFGNISKGKGQELIRANRDVIMRSLNRYFGIELQEWPNQLFYAWRNHRHIIWDIDSIIFLQKGVQFLELLEKSNDRLLFVNKSSFLTVLIKRFIWYFRCVKLWKLARLLEGQKIDYEKSFSENVLEILKVIYPSGNYSLSDAILRMFSVKKRAKVVIWGNGQNWHDFLINYGIEYIKERFNFMGICDRKCIFETDELIIKADELKKIKFDYVIITSDKYYVEIKRELMQDYKVNEEKILFLEQILL